MDKGFVRSPKLTRNICIMAHVDHGKTTLADALVATNGIINQRQAGKIRYMDSRKDEIERGITMKSSCVTLTYAKETTCFIVNLIDSPGHVDFSSEVTTAVRLCDGTIIVVDVVEGVCAQTKVVLKQAWLEKIRPVLVLNKIDRLIVDMKLEPIDAYHRILNVVEQVNAFMGELYNTDVLGRTTAALEEKERINAAKHLKKDSESSSSVPESLTDVYTNWTISDVDDSDLYFVPEKGNVVFACAYDGWGFRLQDFSAVFSEKIGIDSDTLTNSLWGDFYISSKGGKKCVLGGAREKGKSPLFVSVILDNIFKVYDTHMVRKDIEASTKIASLLGITLPISIARSTDFASRLRYILSNWLPLAPAVLEMVTTQLPSAANLSEERVTKLMCSATQRFESLPVKTQELKQAFLDAKSDDTAPIIVFVSKMFGVAPSCINDRAEQKRMGASAGQKLTIEEIRALREEIKAKEQTEAIKSVEVENEQTEDDEILVAFARVFSGTLRVGQKVYVLGPKHSPNHVISVIGEDVKDFDKNLMVFEHVKVTEIKSIYLLMGRQLEKVNSAPCGSVIGIGGLETTVIKSATLSTNPLCPPFTDLTLQAVPIVRVAVEPVDHRDLKKLREGLKILNQADPCIEIYLEDSGEYVMVTAGEVHLERCVADLQERYAKVPVTTSAPIVPFRETIIAKPKMDRLNEAIQGENVIEGKSDSFNGECEITNHLGKLSVRALPLPPGVTKLLEDNLTLIQTIIELSSKHFVQLNLRNGAQSEIVDCDNRCSENEEVTVKACREEVVERFTADHSHTELPGETISEDALNSIEKFKEELFKEFKEAGAEWDGFIDNIWTFGPGYGGPNILINNIKSYPKPSIFDRQPKYEYLENELSHYDTNFNMGFQMATSAGPLCEEPMHGICFVVDEWELSDCNESGTLSGQIISLVKDALRKAFENSSQRLMVAMYSSVISVTSDVVGKVYNVLGKRHGRITDGDITEGSTSWNVTAYLPVIESFDFANELRKATSGEAIPQLLFSHWETIQIDPAWVPQTTEELTHWGEKADSANLARKYINIIRKRKGLFTDEKIVEFAEKQRNLSKNK